MKTTTVKYLKEDKVWIIENMKAIEKTVNECVIKINNNTEISYYLEDDNDNGNIDYTLVKEEFCFKTKKELIESL